MMKNYLYVVAVMLIVLAGCGDAASNKETTHMTRQVDDFDIDVMVEESPTAYATITYTGEDETQNIEHGGSIFLFNLYDEHGKREYVDAMTEQLVTTTLEQNKALRVDFTQLSNLELKKGRYTLEVIADFWLPVESLETIDRPITMDIFLDIP